MEEALGKGNWKGRDRNKLGEKVGKDGEVGFGSSGSVTGTWR